ncbi:MAG TPA: Xaa-Pro peptidase family protein [Syntrophomonadaceae bacterium]|nr:Xaa-Pro peptidase family protein [Syntrophomonadaceae bacterium]
MNQRITRLRQSLEKLKLDGIIIDRRENIYYLSGFTGGADARLLVTDQETLLFTDSRYTEQAARESPEWTLIEEKPPLGQALKERVRRLEKVGLEDTVSYRLFRELREEMDETIIPVSDVVEELRVIKEPEELENLRKAAAIGSEVFSDLLLQLQAGMTERSVACLIISALRQRGAEKESFDPIAVSGPNASLPHGMPGDRVLQKGDMLTLDYGGFYQGYAGDMTRTVAIGEAGPRLRDLYAKLLEAQQYGVEQVRAGLKCSDLDRLVRERLREYDLDQFFAHSTGHGIGLEIHESPSVSSRSQWILQEGMVITIEPGVYIPGWGGIRIEDSVIVKNYGCEVITNSPKQLIVI